jgi:hypothetical protein
MRNATGFDAWLIKVQANNRAGRVVAYVTTRHGSYLGLMDFDKAGETWLASVDFAQPITEEDSDNA